MTDASEWQGRVGESWANEWRRTDRSFGGLTKKLLACARDTQFDHALDIGCGAGELSLALAQNRPESLISGVDISSRLIETARERAANHTNLSFIHADAAHWQAPFATKPDFLMSRHGVMFFADPTAAFANLAANARDGATLLFSCFRQRADNPIFTEIARLLPTPPVPANADPDAPGPFAFADEDRVTKILTVGGWGNVGFERFDFSMIIGGGSHPAEDALQYFRTIGVAAAVMRELDEGQRQEVEGKILEFARAHEAEGIVALPASCWIVTASKK